MLFTSLVYGVFLVLVLIGYWSIRHRAGQNLLILAASYVFFGWVHPWFCVLIAVSTLTDYGCALGIDRVPRHRRSFLALSVLVNLGMLGYFKYFGFFVDNLRAVLEPLGWHLEPRVWDVFLPVGISFYTFQTLGYTIDVYRGTLRARTNLVDFAVFVSFFPQLVAGPIERASHFLPQVETPRRFHFPTFASAGPLLVRGLFKKVVVADNLARWVDRVYQLESPSASVYAVGTVMFCLQLYADFSAYTDLARGSARLLGFELMENFRTPFLSRSVPEFWTRWHISLMTWIRDYVFIPLGGSRVGGTLRQCAVLLVAFTLSGLWHGAAWHYVLFGAYNGVAVVGYRLLGIGSKWAPRRRLPRFGATLLSFVLVAVGLSLFRAPDLAWFSSAITPDRLGLGGDEGRMAAALLGVLVQFSFPWFVEWRLAKRFGESHWASGLWRWVLVGLVVVIGADGGAFVYFQF